MASLHPIRKVPLLPPRATDANKGNFGRVLVIGGSIGMSGAPSLAGMAALRSGAGLVTIAVPEPIVSIVAGLCPCATTVPLPANKSGQIKPAAATRLLRARGWIGPRGSANPPDAVVIGPGVGTGPHEYADRFWELIDAFRIESEVPAVLDADALNLAAILAAGWDHRPHPRTVITPHPGELGRLLGRSARDVQAARERGAQEAVDRLNRNTEPAARATVLLKGARTLVTDGLSLYTNRTGNPGMATGGSGDVLSGIIGALLGQRLGCLDAAVLGAYVHGAAGDVAARRLGEVSMIATDLLEALPEAFRSLGPAVRRTRGPQPRGKSR